MSDERREALARAVHRLYCHKPDELLHEPDETDYDKADEFLAVLGLVDGTVGASLRLLLGITQAELDEVGGVDEEKLAGQRKAFDELREIEDQLEERVRWYDENGEPHDDVLRTKTGKILTDADIEALSEEADRGYDVDKITAYKDRDGWHSVGSNEVPTTCHCGKIANGHVLGLCKFCSDVRCDAFPGECNPDPDPDWGANRAEEHGDYSQYMQNDEEK